jgi:hypothetical protein
MDIEIRITDPETLPECRPILTSALARKHPHVTEEEADFLWDSLKQANRPSEFGSYLNALGFHSHVGNELRKTLQEYLKGQEIVVIPRPAKDSNPVTASHIVGLKRLDAVARKIWLNKKLADLRE